MIRYSLRPYQIDVIERVRESMREGHRRVLLTMPTGGGKTLCACALIEAAFSKGRRVLFLAHRKELIDQTSAKLDEIGLADHGVIKAGHPRLDYARPIQVASVPTLVRRLDAHRLRDLAFDLIVQDEAHHLPAVSFSRVIEAWPQAWLLGLTATPYRADGSGLGDHFDSLIEAAAMTDLIRDGWLVRPRVFSGSTAALKRVHIRRGDYDAGELGAAMDTPKLVGDVVRNWQRLAANRITIGFAVSIAHSRHLAAEFRKAGVEAEHLDGGTPPVEREAILGRLAGGRTRIVFNCGVLSEGWDMPQCSAIILARPTKSRGLWKQMCGRTLRPFSEKTDCIVLDHAGCCEEHGFLTDPDPADLSGVRKAEPKERAMIRCKACDAAFPPRERIWDAGHERWRCPNCDTVLPATRSHFPETDSSVDLAEHNDNSGERAASIERRRSVFRRLVALALARGYKPGWVGVRFKAKFGDYPTRTDQEGAPMRTRLVRENGQWQCRWIRSVPIEQLESGEIRA